MSIGSATGAPPPTHAPSLSHASSSLSATQHARLLGVAPDGVSSSVTLEMSAKGLRNKDFVGKSDPVVVVSMAKPSGGWERIGQTEVIENNLNPHWEKRIEVDYVFEKVQMLAFQVYDVDKQKEDGTVTQKEFLGQLFLPLGELLSRGTAVFDLSGRGTSATNSSHGGGGRGYGRFCIRVHESNGGTFHRVHLTLSARNVDRANTFGFGLSDPYVTIKQLSDDAGQLGVNVLRVSDIVKQQLNPDWRPMSFDVVTGAREFSDINLELELKDWNSKKEHVPLGAVQCTLEDLMKKTSFPIHRADKKKKSKNPGGNSGFLLVKSASVVPYPSHVEYLQGGCHLRAVFAVDMTSSGGLLTDPKSPHFSDTNKQSIYAQALKSVGDVVAPYLQDDQMVTAYAFGAKHQNSGGAVSHAFPLNPAAWDSGDARVVGSQNLVNAYANCVKAAEFSGPTRFSEVLQRALDFSNTPPPTQQKQHYTVLLVLTNGGCTDMDDSIRKICTASESAPLSVVFVGVGNRQDWSDMKYLDADDGRLPRTRDGVEAKRDIVDFVKYDPTMSADALAAEVLREVPMALREYLAEKRIRPNPPPQGDLLSVSSRGSSYRYN